MRCHNLACTPPKLHFFHQISSSSYINWLSNFSLKMSGQPLDIEEWDLVVGKMLRYHDNLSVEIGKLIQQIKSEMKPELVPVAEEKANYGKVRFKSVTTDLFFTIFINFFRLSNRPSGQCGLWTTRSSTFRNNSSIILAVLTSTTSPMTLSRMSCFNPSLSRVSSSASVTDRRWDEF